MERQTVCQNVSGPCDGMHVGGDMENLWIMFDHVKVLKHWTTLACHVYDNKYCKILMIVCCDMQSKYGIA